MKAVLFGRMRILPGEALWQLARRGLLEQRGRGIYALTDHEYTERHSLAGTSKRCTSKELWKYAEICRVANVMRPYFESLA